MVGLNTTPNVTTNPFVTTLVLRGAAAKDIKSITGRLVGMMMGEAKPKIVRKGARVLVGAPRSKRRAEPAGNGWVWWPENEDLVIGFTYTDADAIIDALDKPSQSALDHALVHGLARPEGSFVPLMTMLVDPSAIPEFPPDSRTQMAVFFEKLKATGLNRLDYRWGFDDDALMSVTRLVAPAPRKPIWRSSINRRSTSSESSRFPRGLIRS